MVTHNFELINPALARQYLEQNTEGQRRLRPAHVDFLAREMREERWKYNGDSIRFDENDKLIDGQHRLSAVVLSGKSIRFLVARGIDPEAFTTIDTGRKIRNAADYLSMQGEVNSGCLSSALNVLYQLQNGLISRSRQTLPVKKILNVLEDNPAIRNSIPWAQKRMVKRLLKPSVIICLHYIFSSIHKNMADSFFGTLHTGETKNGKRNTALTLRETLFRIKLNGGNKVTINREYEIAIVIKAWNAYIKGVLLTKLVYNSKKEKSFPVIDTKIRMQLNTD